LHGESRRKTACKATARPCGILTSPRREANLKKAKSATRIAAESTAVETLKKNGPDSHAVQEWDSPEELKHAEADGMDRV